MKLEVQTWLWLWYPILVIGLILISLNYVLVSTTTWQDLKNRHEQVESQEQLAARLQTKLTQLRGLNEGITLNNLKILNGVVPASKQLLLLLNQLQASTDGAQTKLIDYKGEIGEVTDSTTSGKQVSERNELVLVATFDVPDLDHAQKLIHSLETKLPLVEVREAHFTPGKAIVTVEGVWGLLSKLTFDVSSDLPDEPVKFDQLQATINQFNPAPNGEEAKLPETGTNPNPF